MTEATRSIPAEKPAASDTASTMPGALRSTAASECDAPAIRVSGLTKTYGRTRDRGVFDLDFSVRRGEVFGFLGPNGAGKTVTMRNLMGFIRPDAGTATILGHDCFAKRPLIQAHLGYLPGEMALMGDMTAGSFIELMARMKGLADKTRARELADLFELDLTARIRPLSKGNRQKIGIVCAFMGTPDVLLLDEPTSGLDPLMQERFIKLVVEEKRRGATVLLSSHIFEEVERTCDRVAFIRQGRIAAVRDMAQMRSERTCAVEVAFSIPEEAARYLTEHEHAEKTGDSTVLVHLSGNADAFVKDLGRYCVAAFRTREQTLEEIFLNLYETR